MRWAAAIPLTGGRGFSLPWWAYSWFPQPGGPIPQVTGSAAMARGEGLVAAVVYDLDTVGSALAGVLPHDHTTAEAEVRAERKGGTQFLCAAKHHLASLIDRRHLSPPTCPHGGRHLTY